MKKLIKKKHNHDYPIEQEMNHSKYIGHGVIIDQRIGRLQFSNSGVIIDASRIE